MRTVGSDFTTDGGRLALLSAAAVSLGGLGAVVAYALLRLIGLVTHLSYTGRLGTTLVPPAPGHWGIASVLVPVAGGLAVGLLARFGSDKIRGHGIPEAILAILGQGSRMEARVAVIKPLASAIAIGTGGPFGAEGPIIMTGGAFGSLVGQLLALSSLERRCLLVAGAAAGMSATFGAPVSAVLLAVELLLFEWRPRSLVPVAAASLAAYALRAPLLGTAPLFEAVSLPWTTVLALPWSLVVGLSAGLLSGLCTKAVYLVEDAYPRLRIHWMWWPAVGGLCVGMGGLLVPQALGVGYPTIRALDAGQAALGAALALLAVKGVIWVVSLSSGTSGGVLAPLLMLGAAMGAALGAVLPGHDLALWATVGMAAMLGGTMRAPFTAAVFTLETTRDFGAMVPVFAACVAALVVTVLWIPRSILTEKVARRGIHVAREYAVHPLETASVAEVMRPLDVLPCLCPDEEAATAALRLGPHLGGGDVCLVQASSPCRMRAVSVKSLLAARVAQSVATVGDLAFEPPQVRPDQRAREAVEAMARARGRDVLVVDAQGKVIGLVSHDDILGLWRSALEAEEVRQTTWRSVRRILRPTHAPGASDPSA